MIVTAIFCGLATVASPGVPVSLETDRVWKRLPGTDLAAALDKATQLLGRRRIVLAGVPVDGKVLRDIQKRSRADPLTRAFREHLRIPIDPTDFLYFLDDLLATEQFSREHRPLYFLSSALRAAGILLHPDDVFRNRPRKYGRSRQGIVLSTRPKPPEGRPAASGAFLGPRWTFRYQEARSQDDRLWALYRKNPDFAQRLRGLVRQLSDHGATVVLESTVRDRRRGFLIYGAYILSLSKSESEVALKVARLTRLNRKWGLNIEIVWAHSQGWQRTVHQASKMAEAFGVTYATENGARRSDHYEGRAFDLYAVGLPRVVHLKAPNGKEKKFDLYAEHQSRDLNLTPEMITWIERNFQFKKLRKDYPHWRDAYRP